VLSVDRTCARVLDAFPHVRLINGYGPTENTTFSCCRTIAPGDDVERASIPIGAPIANTTAYVLDPGMRRCRPTSPASCAWAATGGARLPARGRG
jgi:non-ribosomal peptide synthetase component F